MLASLTAIEDEDDQVVHECEERNEQVEVYEPCLLPAEKKHGHGEPDGYGEAGYRPCLCFRHGGCAQGGWLLRNALSDKLGDGDGG